MRLQRYLAATALVAVLGAPAYGQSIIEQFSPNIVDLDSFNSAVVSAPGTLVTSVVGQVANNQLNTTTAAVLPNFSVSQGAGVYVLIDPNTNLPLSPTTGDADLNAINVISATGTGFALSNVIAGGSQSAVNMVNAANLAVFGASPNSSLVQAAGSVDLVATNQMSAVVQNGNATVTGFNGGGSQTAFGSINTASVFVGATTAGDPPVTTPGSLGLTLDQKLTGPNTIVATNSALANSIASGSTILDPTVQNLNQSSTAIVTSIGFTAPEGGTASVVLTGEQLGPTEAGARLGVTLGNTAVGYTGPTTGAGYNLFSGAGGNGIAIVTGVTQNTTFALNNVSGGPGVSIELIGSSPVNGFVQSTGGGSLVLTNDSSDPNIVTSLNTSLQPVVFGGNAIPFVMNGMAARTNNGTASIVGVARDQASDPFTQSFINQQNNLSAGGTLSGTATQTADDIGLAGGLLPSIYANAAVANANSGPVAITGVSQYMNQSFNTASAGLLSATLTQSGDNISSANANVQVASTNNGNASITGAQQVSMQTLNAATTAGISGNLSQGATDVLLVNANVLAANGTHTSTLNGVQVGSLGVNTASFTSGGLGGTISQNAGTVELVNANQLVTVGGFNASVSGLQQSSTAVNVIK